MIDIPGGEAFTKIELLTRGYSKDKKYYVETVDEKQLLLRIADISEFDRKKAEFEIMKRVAALDVPMPQPVDFGLCNDGINVYQLLSWCDGKDAETVFPHISKAELFVLGMSAGQILRKIHTIPAPETHEAWRTIFMRKVQLRLQEYRTNNLPSSEEAEFIKYIEQNGSILERRPQCLRHNDYHKGNMMVLNGKLVIIDFNDYDFGDPWEELVFTVWNAQYYNRFSAGQIRGYFDGEPPIEFWQLLAYYTVSFLPTYISWGTIFGDKEIAKRIKAAQYILNICINTQAPVPSWYLNEKCNELY